MKFKIILHEDDSAKKINWHVNGAHSLMCLMPLNYSSIEEENLEIDSNLIRRAGAEIHSFLLTLNKAYHKTHKFKSISVHYSDDSKYQNKRVLDDFLEGFSLANYKFNTHKTSVKDILFKLANRVID